MRMAQKPPNIAMFGGLDQVSHRKVPNIRGGPGEVSLKGPTGPTDPEGSRPHAPSWRDSALDTPRQRDKRAVPAESRTTVASFLGSTRHGGAERPARGPM